MQPTPDTQDTSFAALNMVKVFHNVCAEVIRHCADPYALSYADAGLHMDRPDFVYAQALYLQGNLVQWRGPEARKAKGHLQSVIDMLRDYTP